MLPIIPAAWGDEIGEFFVKKFGDDIITLFRAVSPDELSDITQSGVFRPHPSGRSMDAKWFSETFDGAKEWGERMFDEFEIVAIAIPRSIADQMHRVKNLDGITNARAAIDDILDNLNETILDLRVVKE